MTYTATMTDDAQVTAVEVMGFGGYTLYRKVWPLPTGVNWWGPAVPFGWFVLGIIGVLVRPAATRRAGRMLLSSEGLSKPAGQGGRHAVVEGDATV